MSSTCRSRAGWLRLRRDPPRGGHPKLFGYSFATLAKLFGFKSEGSVRNAVHRGAFDPSDLASIFAFYAPIFTRQNKPKRKRRPRP